MVFILMSYEVPTKCIGKLQGLPHLWSPRLGCIWWDICLNFLALSTILNFTRVFGRLRRILCASPPPTRPLARSVGLGGEFFIEDCAAQHAVVSLVFSPHSIFALFREVHERIFSWRPMGISAVEPLGPGSVVAPCRRQKLLSEEGLPMDLLDTSCPGDQSSKKTVVTQVTLLEILWHRTLRKV